MTFRIWGEILDCIEIVALNEDQGISFINEKLNDQIKVQQKWVCRNYVINYMLAELQN